MTSVNTNIKANELYLPANFDIGRKCIFSLQFATGSRRRVQAFYIKAIPCFGLDLYISQKERGVSLRKRTHCLY